MWDWRKQTFWTVCNVQVQSRQQNSAESFKTFQLSQKASTTFTAATKLFFQKLTTWGRCRVCGAVAKRNIRAHAMRKDPKSRRHWSSHAEISRKTHSYQPSNRDREETLENWICVRALWIIRETFFSASAISPSQSAVEVEQQKHFPSVDCSSFCRFSSHQRRLQFGMMVWKVYEASCEARKKV